MNLFQAIFNIVNLTKQANGSFGNFAQIYACLERPETKDSQSYN